MPKGIKKTISLPLLQLPDISKSLYVRNEKKYTKPHLKRIKYSPLQDRNKLMKQQYMIQSCIQDKTYEQIQQINKQNSVQQYLKFQNIEDSTNDERQTKSIIGKQSQLNYYGNFKKLQSISQRNTIENSPKSIFTALHQKSTQLNLMPRCLGLIKFKGQHSLLNVNNYGLGDKYIQVLASGLKQAKLVEKCNFSNNRLTSKGVQHLMKSMSSQISEIDLSHNKMTSIDQKLINLVIQNQSHLLKLNLENNLLGNIPINYICRPATYSKHLKYLNIRKNMLTKQCSEQISELISKNTCLEQLYIGMNRIYGEGAIKIVEALKNNNTIKIFDYSFNTLGHGKNTCASILGECFKKNKTLLHVDFSGNNFTKDDSSIIAEGLSSNKKIYGVHFSGNYGYVDSKGFLIIKQQLQTEIHSVIDIRMNSYQITFNRRQVNLQSQIYKNVCWICEGWYEQQFKFIIPNDYHDQKKIVYLHFDFQSYQPRLINLTEKNVKYKTMVPPNKYRYFYTFNHQQVIDQNIDTFIYDTPLQCKFQMYNEPAQCKIVKVNKRTGKALKLVNNWDQLIVTVLPRHIGLVNKRQKKLWNYNDSIWCKQWRLQDEQMTKKCFEKDWKNSKITNIVKNADEQDKVKQILYKHYKIIKQIYRNYSSWSPIGDVWAISNNPFTEFCQLSKIISKDTPLKITDLTFITTNSLSGVDWKSNPLVPERGLVRFQFMQSLIRLSDQKYKKLGLCNNFLESITNLLKDHIMPVSQNFIAQKWRLQQYFIKQNDMLLKKYRPIFSQVYKKNSKLKLRPGQKPFMCLAEFKSIVERVGVAPLYIQQRQINLSFNCSMMTQVDQVENERFMKMSEIQFIQAIARIAFILPGTCKIEEGLAEPIQFHYKLQWLILQMKNNLCSEDLKKQYPTPQKSLFSQCDDEDD